MAVIYPVIYTRWGGLRHTLVSPPSKTGCRKGLPSRNGGVILYLFATLSQYRTRYRRMAVPCSSHLVSKLYPLSQNGRTMLLPPRLKAIPAVTEWPCHAFATSSQSYTGCHRMAVPCFCHLVSKLYPISQNGCAMFLPPCLKAIPDITEWPCHAFATLSQSYARYHRMAVPCCVLLPSGLKAARAIVEQPCHAVWFETMSQNHNHYHRCRMTVPYCTFFHSHTQYHKVVMPCCIFLLVCLKANACHGLKCCIVLLACLKANACHGLEAV